MGLSGSHLCNVTNDGTQTSHERHTNVVQTTSRRRDDVTNAQWGDASRDSIVTLVVARVTPNVTTHCCGAQ